MHKLSSILLIIGLLALPAAAQTVSFTNTGYLTEQDVELRIYYGNGTYAGTLNTSSPITLDPGMDYILFMDQKKVDLFNRPDAWLTWLLSGGGKGLFVTLMIFSLVILVIGVAWSHGRRGGGK